MMISASKGWLVIAYRGFSVTVSNLSGAQPRWRGHFQCWPIWGIIFI